MTTVYSEESKMNEAVAFEDRRYQQIQTSMGTLKRKQAYRSILQGDIVPKAPPPMIMTTPFIGDDNSALMVLDEGYEFTSKQRQRHAAAAANLPQQEAAAQRLRDSLRKDQEEIAFLEERELKRKQALEQERLARVEEERLALQKEQAELWTIEQERQELQREKAQYWKEQQEIQVQNDNASLPSLDGTVQTTTSSVDGFMIHFQDLIHLFTSFDITAACTDYVCLHGRNDKGKVWTEEEPFDEQ